MELSKDLADALKALSRREGATLFMTLLTGFAVLLYRYSALEDVAIGTVSSGRKRSELEGLLGYFLNPVVLRNDLSGDPTFRELLRRTRNVTLDALSNDDAPFTQVVNEVRPNRSLSFNPLFQVLLTLEPPMPQNHDGWTVRRLPSRKWTPEYPNSICALNSMTVRPALWDVLSTARTCSSLKPWPTWRAT